MKKRVLLCTSLCFLVAAVAMAAEVPGSMPGSSLQPSSSEKISGAAAVSNTYTIEELFKNGAELNNKKVVVHGQVIKVTPNIMGKIWTHLQDDTGDKNKGNNDLICISATDRAEVGEMVTVTGTVAFNSESRYKLVIEDAAINK